MGGAIGEESNGQTGRLQKKPKDKDREQDKRAPAAVPWLSCVLPSLSIFFFLLPFLHDKDVK